LRYRRRLASDVAGLDVPRSRHARSSSEARVSRVAFDAYYTPAWPVLRLLERYALPTGGSWLEPMAGSGNIIRAVNSVAPVPPDWTAIEIREECKGDLIAAGASAVIVGDFFRQATPLFPYDVAAGNPAYSTAMEAVRLARLWANYVVFLLRLDFLASAKRADFMRNDQPDVCVLPDRIAFEYEGSKGGTDQYDYGWFIWRPERRREGKIITLDATPARERRALRSAA
jgi:hypothetical protein